VALQVLGKTNYLFFVALQVSGKTNYLFFVALQVSGKTLFIFCGLTGIRKNRIRRGAVFMLSRTITGKYTSVVYDYNTITL
jgi:hypothetical protein